MLVCVQIDLTGADLPAFDAYEIKALGILSQYGASVVERVRSCDTRSEFHLLEFPDRTAFDSFLADPVRAAMKDEWTASGARSTVSEVTSIG